MIIKDCELWFPKLDKPSARFNKDNPTYELQIRTTNKDQKKEWELAGLNVKPIVPDEGEIYYRVNLRKKSIKEDGTKASPVDVVDMQLNPISGSNVGNGSIGNVRIFQYNYKNANGTTGVASVLMGVQLKVHKVFEPNVKDDDFEAGEEETKVIMPAEETEE